MEKERIIGRYVGQQRGPLLICLGGIHGNEPSGVRAIERFFELLRQHSIADFRGGVLGLRGNLQALEKGARFLEKDLNRIMTPWMSEQVRSAPLESLSAEYRELRELLDLIDSEIDRTNPETLALVDLHTTSADGGIFSIPDGSPESIALARHFHVPIVLGMSGGLDGTSLSFFSPQYRDIPTRVAAFEAGQNEDPASELRSAAAIVNALKAIGCIGPEELPNPYEQLLRDAAAGLPHVSELVEVHLIQPGDGFAMRPGYRNFQQVKKGEHLADDYKGPINSSIDGLVLMPLYQSQGSNGFFLVREVN
ncbi:MAG: succinylglutamate desuccinylase/aspartoacylase family protein [Saprospiraceae bacterium]